MRDSLAAKEGMHVQAQPGSVHRTGLFYLAYAVPCLGTRVLNAAMRFVLRLGTTPVLRPCLAPAPVAVRVRRRARRWSLR